MGGLKPCCSPTVRIGLLQGKVAWSLGLCCHWQKNFTVNLVISHTSGSVFDRTSTALDENIKAKLRNKSSRVKLYNLTTFWTRGIRNLWFKLVTSDLNYVLFNFIISGTINTSILNWAVFVQHRWEVQHFLYSCGLTPKLVQHLLAPIKKRVHNGAVKSRGQFNYNLSTLLVTVFYTAPLSYSADEAWCSTFYPLHRCVWCNWFAPKMPSRIGLLSQSCLNYRVMRPPVEMQQPCKESHDSFDYAGLFHCSHRTAW